MDDTDLYCWEDALKADRQLSVKIEEDTYTWGDFLIATRSCLKPENCFWYLLDYDCVGGVREPAGTAGCELFIPSDG